MAYSSPIRLVADDLRSQIEKDLIEVIHNYEIQVDKDELIKALAYDREQYKKGYADGLADGKRTVKVEDITCECGNKLGFGDNYCSQCGARLEWE